MQKICATQSFVYATDSPEDVRGRKRTRIIAGGAKGIFLGLVEKSTLDMAAFFVIAGALKESGILEKGMKLIIGKPETLAQVLSIDRREDFFVFFYQWTFLFVV